MLISTNSYYNFVRHFTLCNVQAVPVPTCFIVNETDRSLPTTATTRRVSLCPTEEPLELKGGIKSPSADRGTIYNMEGVACNTNTIID